ncbi:MAG: hypothetical protein C5B51_01625 [Terriglobia bacterium]|nr:MAG: hypothetical protein C5B51_01625 [Terriglobia bacterium]
MGLLVAALLTGIASLYQAYVSGRNADAAVEAVRIAKDTLYITESADIELEGCNCSTAPQLLNAQTRIAVIYKNTGRTSAARVKSRIFTGFEGDTGPGTTVGPEGESTVGAGQSIGTGFSGLGMPHVAGLPGMTPQIESAINMSAAQEITAKIATRQLRVVSWVTYYDKFERGHITLLESTYERGTTCMFLTRKIISR